MSVSFKDIESKIESAIDNIKRGTLNVLSVEWTKSVRQNFRAGGRPAWQPRSVRYARSKKAKGTNIMRISGALMNVNTVPNYTTNTVEMKMDPRARAYAKIHNEGGTINMPARKIKFKKSKAGRTVFAGRDSKRIVKETVSKPYIIKIPKREFTNFPNEDFGNVVTRLKAHLQL